MVRERRPGVADDGLPERHANHADSEIVLGIQLLELVANRTKLPVRRLSRNAGLEPSHHVKVVRSPHTNRIAHERRDGNRIEVVFVALRHHEVVGEHAHDRPIDVVQPNRLADDIFGSRKYCLPGLPWYDGDEGGIAHSIFVAEVRPLDETDAERREERGLDPTHSDDLRIVARVVDGFTGRQPCAE
jgi:hypothetical protein